MNNGNKLVIFDIDSTIADNSHRISHILQKPVNWNLFFSLSHKDNVIEQTKLIYDALRAQSGVEIGIVTARNEENRKMTEDWLDLHGFHGYKFLLMRRLNDFRPDFEIKEEILLSTIIPAYGKPFMAFEDNSNVIKNCWRKHGIFTLDVGVNFDQQHA